MQCKKRIALDSLRYASAACVGGVRFTMKFKHQQWSEELQEALDGYIAIHDPIICSDALRTHYENSRLIEVAGLGYRVQEEEKGNSVSEEDVKNFRQEWIEEFVSQGLVGVMTYRRQMIVIAVTLLEAMLRDFVSSYFYAKPESMYSFVGDCSGSVSFKDVLKYDTKREYMSHLSESAAQKFISQKWSVLFKSLDKLLKEEIPNSEGLIVLAKQRNDIIHEGKKIEVSNEHVFSCFDIVRELIEFLAEKSNK